MQYATGAATATRRFVRAPAYWIAALDLIAAGVTLWLMVEAEDFPSAAMGAGMFAFFIVAPIHATMCLLAMRRAWIAKDSTWLCGYAVMIVAWLAVCYCIGGIASVVRWMLGLYAVA